MLARALFKTSDLHTPTGISDYTSPLLSYTPPQIYDTLGDGTPIASYPPIGIAELLFKALYTPVPLYRGDGLGPGSLVQMGYVPNSAGPAIANSFSHPPSYDIRLGSVAAYAARPVVNADNVTRTQLPNSTLTRWPTDQCYSNPPMLLQEYPVRPTDFIPMVPSVEDVKPGAATDARWSTTPTVNGFVMTPAALTSASKSSATGGFSLIGVKDYSVAETTA
jgi:hypothetical protein